MEVIHEMIGKFIELTAGDREVKSAKEVPVEVKHAFFAVLKRIEMPKSTVLNVPGKSSEKIYFIEKGLLINTCLIDGKEIGTHFVSEGGVGGDIISFLTTHKSKRTVKVIEDSTLWSLNRSDFSELTEKHPEAEYIKRTLFEFVVVSQQNRIEDLIYGSTVVRYKKFEANFPDIVHRLPLSFLATYLGMSRETLSRIRSMK